MLCLRQCESVSRRIYPRKGPYRDTIKDNMDNDTHHIVIRYQDTPRGLGGMARYPASVSD